jgi:DNA-binding NarL/FixJ family response regulator
MAEHALVRAGLRALLGATPGLAVIAEAADIDVAASLAASVQPDVLLLDAPSAQDLKRAVASLRVAAPRACVLCLGDDEHGVGTIRCIPRDAGVAELCSALADVLGERCGACLLRSRCAAATREIALSPRERQVAIHVAAGLASKQIAAVLGIGLRTVNTYRESLARKLGASSAAVLTRYVLEHGLDART